LVQLEQQEERRQLGERKRKESGKKRLHEKQNTKKGKRKFRRNPLLEHVPSDETDLEISEINS